MRARFNKYNKFLLLSLVMGLAFIYPFSSFASVITQQSGFGYKSDDSYSSVYQYLGDTIYAEGFRYFEFKFYTPDSSGYVGNFVLSVCTNSSYNVCDQYLATDINGLNNGVNISIGSAGTHTMVADFSYYVYCAYGVSCTSVKNSNVDPINFNTGDFIYIYYQVSTDVDQSPASGNLRPFGTNVLLTDFHGNPLYCGHPNLGDPDHIFDPVETCYYVVTDDLNTILGSFNPASNSAGWDISGANSYCDDNYPTGGFIDIANALCKVLGNLVIPSQSSVNSLSTLFSVARNKFPFGWFYLMSDTVETVWNSTDIASTSSMASLSFNNITFKSITSDDNLTTKSFQVFTIASVSDIFGSSGWFHDLRDIMGYMLYMFFGFALFFKLSNIFRS